MVNRCSFLNKGILLRTMGMSMIVVVSDDAFASTDHLMSDNLSLGLLAEINLMRTSHFTVIKCRPRFAHLFA